MIVAQAPTSQSVSLDKSERRYSPPLGVRYLMLFETASANIVRLASASQAEMQLTSRCMTRLDFQQLLQAIQPAAEVMPDFEPDVFLPFKSGKTVTISATIKFTGRLEPRDFAGEEDYID